MFQRRVTTPISAQCHSCKHSHGSVLADLTKSALSATKKKRSEIVSGWCQGLIYKGCLLDFPAKLALTCCIWLIISFVAIILLQPVCLKQHIHNSFLIMVFPHFCSLCHTFRDLRLPFSLYDPPDCTLGSTPLFMCWTNLI